MNVYLPPSIIFPKQQGRYSAFILKPHFVFRYIFATIHLDFKTPVYSPRRGRFVNSAFPNKKNLAQKRSLFMTSKFESKCLQQFYVSSKHEKECYMKTTSYLEEPNRHFCQHFMRRTTQQTFSTINLASQQKTTKLFFSSQVRKQFKLLAVPFKSLRCCLRSV